MKKLLFIILALSTYQLINLSTVSAAPHISGKRIHGQPKDHVHKLPDINKLRAKGLAPQAIKEAIGASGTKKVAVILVNFASAGTASYGVATMTSSDINGFNTTFSAIKNFFREASHNQLNLDITFFYSGGSAAALSGTETPYPLSAHEISWYGDDSETSLAQLVKDALAACGGTVSKGAYDCVMVAHAGYGEETTGTSGDIWSSFISWGTAYSGFTEGTIVPARESGSLSPIGVTCHEFGHQLGLPDLYNTDYGTTQVGKWCLMDIGTWAGSPAGSNPSHPSIWCKQLLGWVTPVSISSAVTNASLAAIEVSSQGTKIPVPVASDPANEYFLLEYRYTGAASYDQGLPGSGILIWHIDDSVGGGTSHWDFATYNDINNNYLHRRVDLEEADTTDPSSNNGNSTDPWPGTKSTFNSPQSDAYNGTPSGITVLNFTGSGSSTMTYGISFQPWIRGLVKNSAGEGISGIPVTVISTYTVTISTTDSSGQYLVSIASGTYTLMPETTVSGKNYGYYPSSRTVTVVDYSDNQDFTATLRTEIATSAGSAIVPENNIFNPAKGEKTTIWYKIPGTSQVKLKIYTFDGILVKTLIDDYKDAGYYTEFWYGKNDAEETVASGIYLLYFDVDGAKQVKKIAIIK